MAEIGSSDIQAIIPLLREVWVGLEQTRESLLDASTSLIALFDRLQGDPDLEDIDEREGVAVSNPDGGTNGTQHDEESEPSLGSLPAIDQTRWAAGGFRDLEGEHDGREHDLGAPDNVVDQTRWSAGGQEGDELDYGELDDSDREPEDAF